AGTPIFLPQKITLFLFGGPDLFTPKTHLVPFRGPRSLARSRYCASPEASIMRLKAASTKWLYALKTSTEDRFNPKKLPFFSLYSGRSSLLYQALIKR
ncbi:MAG: hypothetical protein PHX33_06995, partial [Candidatus Cloacimonetes bacterium]|nr:hypothetical protein [Candidatus Cloacimonadota bacterium]